jgi:PAS domain S-box-containing protein
MLASLIVFSNYFEKKTNDLKNNQSKIEAITNNFKHYLLNEDQTKISPETVNIYFQELEKCTKNTISEKNNSTINSLLNTFILMLTILLILFMFFGYLLDHTIAKSLQSLKTGMEVFFNYVINKDKSADTIEIIYDDEIGAILKYINQNLRQVKTIIEDDREFNLKLKESIKLQTNQLTKKSNYLEQYKYMVDESESVIQFDIFGNIIEVNAHYCNLSKYTKEELLGQPITNYVNSIDPDDGFSKEITNIIKEGIVYKGINSDLTKDGKKFTTKTVIIPIISEEGIIEYFFCIRTDITQLIELTNEIIDTQKDVISTMGEIGESRSKETGLHVKRVAEYSKLLAIKYGLNKEDCDLVYNASPMHDIGKVGIADSILKKPGKLTHEEFEIMKTHTTLGYNMLKNSKRDILSAAAVISYEHHEKYDGTGYPNNKVGEDIHIFGRITAVADIFDALGSDRCYKKSWPLENILKLFTEQKGKHLDPVLVDLFIKNLDEFLVIREKFKDNFTI